MLAISPDTAPEVDGADDVVSSLTSLQRIIDCLFRLSTTLQSPAPEDEYEFGHVPKAVQASGAHSLRNLYPSMNETIILRLLGALGRRESYFEYRKHKYGETSQCLVGDTQRKTIPGAEPFRGEEAGDERTGSDDDKSDVSETSYAASDTSPRYDNFPPMPEKSKDGHFECSFSHSIVSLRSQKDWKYVSVLER